jgi:glycosyltransferase involved in cell wall biosynthesis
MDPVDSPCHASGAVARGSETMTQVLIVSHDVVGRRMAGPGIRYWELSRVLSRDFQVTLAVPGDTSISDQEFDVLAYPADQPSTLDRRVREADVVLTYGYMLHEWPFLASMDTPWIADVYVPEPTEALAWHGTEGEGLRKQNYRRVFQTLEPLVQHADFYICANERQRDFWLGLLTAYGRISPDVYEEDPTLRRLIDVVPFGLPSVPPSHSKRVLKGVWPGILDDDKVVLWGGGIWDWLDPLTALRAMRRVVEEHPKARLVFPGTRHPNVTAVPDMTMRKRALALAQDLGLAGRSVFFGDWVEYDAWENFLLEADIALSCHLDTVETRFAFRTRLLDSIWAGLPMVVTGGDSTSELVTRYGLGVVVPAGDEQAMAAAIGQMLDTPELRGSYRERFDLVRPLLAWERVSEPITRFCERKQTTAKDEASATRGDSRARTKLITEREAEVVRLRALVAAYEGGRFMRMMRWVDGWLRRVGAR